MKSLKMLVVIGIVLATANSVFAVGGVLPDGQGTNWSYGDVNGQGTYYLRNFRTANIDGSGVTNIPSDGIVSLDAAKLTGAIGAIDLGNGTNVSGANITGTVPAARLGENLEKLAGNDASSVTNLNATELRSGTVADARLSAALQALAANNGTALTGVVAVAGSDVLTTNATPQSKAGLLTLNGGLEVDKTFVLKLGSLKSIAADAEIEVDAANVKVESAEAGNISCSITNGATEGQVLTIRGTSDTKTVTLTNAVPPFRLGLRDVISFIWDGSAWVEQWRRDN